MIIVEDSIAMRLGFMGKKNRAMELKQSSGARNQEQNSRLARARGQGIADEGELGSLLLLGGWAWGVKGKVHKGKVGFYAKYEGSTYRSCKRHLSDK